MPGHDMVKIALEFLDEAAYLVNRTKEVDFLTEDERRDIGSRLARIAAEIGSDGRSRPEPA